MEFEWDETKRRKNIERHRIDFLDADKVFAGPVIIGPARSDVTEERWLATGVLGDVHVSVVYTWRGQAVRIISMRRARVAERARHQAVYAGRT